MNDSPNNETENIRSDIDTTRRRMDDTMDALGDRLQPRHLLDEVLGFLRSNNGDGESRLKQMGEKLGHSCNSAMHSVVDSVKQNPMPAILIGAGVAWMIYASRRDTAGNYDVSDYSASDAARRYDPDSHYDRPLDYPAATTDEGGSWSGRGGQEESKLGGIKETLKDRAGAAGEQVKNKLSQAGEAAREKIGALRDRASEMTDRVKDSTRETYNRTRERVVTTADHHPLEVGLAALAAGLFAGLLIPTPNAINRSVGPAADRLRQRTREAGNEMIQKGKRVAEAAVAAVKDEANAQGLTADRLREKVTAIGERAKDAGQEAANREGLTTGGNQPKQSGQACDPQIPKTSTFASDPTAARPGA